MWVHARETEKKNKKEGKAASRTSTFRAYSDVDYTDIQYTVAHAGRNIVENAVLRNSCSLT